MPQQRDIWEDRFEHLQHLPDFVLANLARNESATRDYRRFAVELLVNRKSEMVKHPDFKEFLHELEVELEGIEFGTPDLGPGPLFASITTDTMFASDPVSSLEPLSADAETDLSAEKEDDAGDK